MISPTKIIIIVYRENAERNELDKKFQKFCATRWTSHEETLSCFICNLAVIIETLQILSEDSSSKTCSTATSLLNTIHKFQFLACLIIVEYYLKFTKPLSMILQSPDCDLIRATDDAKDLVDYLTNRRNNEPLFVELFDKIKALGAEIGVEPNTPRLCGRQIHRSNAIVNTHAGSISAYYKMNLHHPFLDHLIAELNSRLLSAVSRVQAHYLLPQRLPQLTDDKWKDIKVTYSSFINVDEIDAELERWRYKYREMRDDTQQQLFQLTLEVCIQITKDLYPNIHNIFLVLLTMPVSTASAERSFSCLKRLKSYLRSTMGAERLNGLAMMHIHHEISVDVDAVLQKFDSSGHRRIALAFPRAIQSSSDSVTL
jgi:hypothetical protein